MNKVVNLKVLTVILTIFMIFSISTISFADNTNYSVGMTLTSDSKLKEGDIVTVNVNLSKVIAGNGIDAMTAKLNYDVNTFEVLSASDLKSSTGWIPTFAPSTNRLTALKNSKVTSAETIFTINLKVKSEITVNSTVISMQDITVSGGIVANGGTGDINVPEISVTISKVQDIKPIEQPDNTNTNTNTNKNTNTNTNTTKKTDKLPKTGIGDYKEVTLLVVAAIGFVYMISYVVNKR